MMEEEGRGEEKSIIIRIIKYYYYYQTIIIINNNNDDEMQHFWRLVEVHLPDAMQTIGYSPPTRIAGAGTNQPATDATGPIC